jgi:hypothetical protein
MSGPFLFGGASIRFDNFCAHSARSGSVSQSCQILTYFIASTFSIMMPLADTESEGLPCAGS